MKSKCDHGDHIVCNECTYPDCEICKQAEDFLKPGGDVARVHLDQAQLHADDYVDKNYPDEREVSKLKEASMQNKPQLSAEIKERFELARRRLSPIIDLDRDPPVEFTAVKCSTALAELDDLEKLFATALEEQRQEILSEVDGWLDEMPIYMETDGYSGDKPSFAPFRAELRAKLNQLKGEI